MRVCLQSLKKFTITVHYQKNAEYDADFEFTEKVKKNLQKSYSQVILHVPAIQSAQPGWVKFCAGPVL